MTKSNEATDFGECLREMAKICEDGSILLVSTMQMHDVHEIS